MILHVAHPPEIDAQAPAGNRILELRQDLRIRLLQNVRQHVETAAMRHRDHHVLHAALGGIVDDLVDDRDHHVQPLDRKARLAGERAVQEALEGFNLRDAIEQLLAVNRIVGRPELRRLHCLTQPYPLIGHEHVVVVVAGRRTVDLTEAADGFKGIGRAGGGGPGHDRGRQGPQSVAGEPVRLRRQRRIADRIVKAERIELGRQMAESANRLGECMGGNRGIYAGPAFGPGSLGAMVSPLAR